MPAIIPLTTAPNQTFQVSVPVDGAYVNIKAVVRYSEPAKYWLMDIYKPDGSAMAMSIPLITSSYPAANIISHVQYLGLGSACIVPVGMPGFDAQPSIDDLGIDYLLVWSDSLDPT